MASSDIKPAVGTMRGWNSDGELIFEQKNFVASKDKVPRSAICTAMFDPKTDEVLPGRRWDPQETGYWLM